MKPFGFAKKVVAALLAMILPVAGVQAAKLSWFDENPMADNFLINASPGLSLGGVSSRITFGVKHYSALEPNPLLEEDARFLTGARHGLSGDVFHLYTRIVPEPTPAVPARSLLHPAQGFEDQDSRLNALGAKWQHRLSTTNSVALSASAGYTEYSLTNQPVQDVLSTRAAISWTSKWSDGWRPGITGSLFVGDETARDESYRYLGRRVYGFALGGEVTVFQDHTPYVTYRLQRSLYDTVEDPLYLPNRADEYSLISAGWRWRVQRNWSLQAEATYSLNGGGLDLYTPDRSRIFFGTRFDFR